jgi:multidrug efflux pump subunit AcrB
MTSDVGVAGRLAAAFIDSKLTPLFIVGSLALGAAAIVVLPREEEPQIVVPMIDVFVDAPGVSAAEVEQRVTRPMEQLLWEVPGVEYLYSTSSAGQSMVVVRFFVGEDEDRALVRVNQKLSANVDRIPIGVSFPIVRMRSIDDVPVMALTLWGPRYEDHQLRQIAAQVREAIADVPDVSEIALIGGRPREVRVEVDPARLAAAGLDPLRIAGALEAANARASAAGPVRGGGIDRLEAGDLLRTVDDVRAVVVSADSGGPTLLRDVATVTDGDAEPVSYVRYHSRTDGAHPAVTLSIAKRKGANAITIVHLVEAKLDTLRGVLLPDDLTVSVTRNYGETAAEKSNELLYHMFLAVLSVSVLIGLALGAREAAVVLIAIPVTLALTLFAFAMYGYSLNRITLFALIFSIGILVDDAIVVVENVVRHARLRTGEASGLAALTIRAVDEVGNPTILATLTVVAAILPMAFVGGLMGPYMRPIPVGASAAMLFSLAAAFIVTPWGNVTSL